MKKIKIFIQIILISFALTSSASSSAIMECLGKEELLLHKTKKTGPSYKLNQLLIDKFTGFGELKIKESYLSKICKPPRRIKYTNSVSYKLIKSLLLNGEKIFDFTKIKGSSGTVSFRISTIKKFSNNLSIHIFFDYLSTLQGLLINPKCLTKRIPEVKYFRDRLKYLEADYPIRKLIDEKIKMAKLIQKLSQFKKIMKRCR